MALVVNQTMQSPVAAIESTAPVATESKATTLKMTRSEGFEIFVGRMPLATTKADLRALAAPFEPTHVRVLPKRDFAHLCGFVVFGDLKNAQEFLDKFNGVAGLGGSDSLNVRFADGKKARKKVFIGGLARSTGVEELRKIVEVFGTVLTINVLGQDHHAPCGFATFAKASEATACIAALHDSPNADGTKKYVIKLGKSCVNSKSDEKKPKKSKKRASSDDESTCDSGSESASKRRKNWCGASSVGSASTIDSFNQEQWNVEPVHQEQCNNFDNSHMMNFQQPMQMFTPQPMQMFNTMPMQQMNMDGSMQMQMQMPMMNQCDQNQMQFPVMQQQMDNNMMFMPMNNQMPVMNNLEVPMMQPIQMSNEQMVMQPMQQNDMCFMQMPLQNNSMLFMPVNNMQPMCNSNMQQQQQMPLQVFDETQMQMHMQYEQPMMVLENAQSC